MSEQRSDQLVAVTFGALHVRAPQGEPEVITGTHGQVAQWTGDGRTLVTFGVAVRLETQMSSPFGIKNHLNWELDRLSEPMTDVVRHDDAGNIEMAGASGAASGGFDGVRLGLATHNRVLVTSDGQDMYVVHVMVTDTPEGRALGAEMLADVRF